MSEKLVVVERREKNLQDANFREFGWPLFESDNDQRDKTMDAILTTYFFHKGHRVEMRIVLIVDSSLCSVKFASK